MLFRRHRQWHQLTAIGQVQIASGGSFRAECLEDRTLLSAVLPLTDEASSTGENSEGSHFIDNDVMNSIRELVSGLLSGRDVQWQPLKSESGSMLMTGVIHTGDPSEAVLILQIISESPSDSDGFPAEGGSVGELVFDLRIAAELMEGGSATVDSSPDSPDLVRLKKQLDQAFASGFGDSFEFRGSLYPDPGNSSEPLLSQEDGATLGSETATGAFSQPAIEPAIPSGRSETIASAATSRGLPDVVDDFPEINEPSDPLPVAVREAVFSPVSYESAFPAAFTEFTESPRFRLIAVGLIDEQSSVSAGAVAALEQSADALLQQMTVTAVTEAAFRPFEPMVGLAGTVLVMVRTTARTLALALQGRLDLEAAPMAAFVEPVLNSPAVGSPAGRLELRTAEDFEPAPFTQTVPGNRAFEIRDIGPMPDPPVEPLEAALTLLTLPRHGVLEHVPGSSTAFRYRPDPGFSGVDEFRFRQTSAGQSGREGQVIFLVPAGSSESGPVAAIEPAASGDVLAHVFDSFEDWFRPME